jgi:hypothetical protein
MQPVAQRDVGPAIALARTDEVAGDPEAIAQRERPRLLGDERVGPEVDDEAVAALGCDRAAEPRAGFEQRDGRGRRAFEHAQRGGDAGDPAADDRDVDHAAALRTTSPARR